jgi:hypothetical protein
MTMTTTTTTTTTTRFNILLQPVTELQQNLLLWALRIYTGAKHATPYLHLIVLLQYRFKPLKYNLYSTRFIGPDICVKGKLPL